MAKKSRQAGLNASVQQEGVGEKGPPSKGPDRWYEFVRTLRTLYDHFRIAFPHMEEIPKYYTEAWGKSFRVATRTFVKTDDMGSVRKVLVGAGYGTEKWDRFVARSPEEVERAIDWVLENEEVFDSNGYSGNGQGNAALQTAEVIADEVQSEEVEETEQELKKQPTTEPEGVEAADEESFEKSEEVVGEEIQEISGEAVSEEWVQLLQKTLRPDQWRILVEQPEVVAAALERFSDEDEAQDSEETSRAAKFLEEKHAELEEEYESLKQRLEEARKEVRDLQGELEDKNREAKALEDRARRAEEQAEEKTPGRGQRSGVERSVQAPSEMAGRLQEYERTIRASEKTIETLRAENEENTRQLEELKDSLQREKRARHQFETELNEERKELGEQIKRLGALLAGGEEIPSIEEFEQMEAEELLDYIEDVEKEKQRALASIDAIDVQEQSYQKQIKVTQEEMDNIQDDLERYKESNLATEVEELGATIERQREQLETLLSFSKNMKAQNEHLKERQDPLRKLVDRLNMQEKALVRYVRLNYDREFMPHQAYHQRSE